MNFAEKILPDMQLSLQGNGGNLQSVGENLQNEGVVAQNITGGQVNGK